MGHALPHIPQWSSSFCLFTQAPMQISGCDGRHVHIPLSQPCVVVHARPHLPQLLWLTSVLTHAPKQNVESGVQAGTHAPFVHVSPEPQTVPQPPQFFSSESGSMHAPSHSDCPIAHCNAHVPLLQT